MRLVERKCRPCARGDHVACIGVACFCRDSDRCAANAILSRERSRNPDDAA